MSQFAPQFNEIIHRIHRTLDIDPNAQPKIQKEIQDLRLFISRIVLSYMDISGTTELIT